MSGAVFSPNVEPQAGAPEPLCAPEAVPPGLAAMLRSTAATPEEQAHAEVAHSARLLAMGCLGAELMHLSAGAVAGSPVLRNLIERTLNQVANTASPLLADPVLAMTRDILERMAATVHAEHLRAWAPIESERAN